jgi:hypothetical protein
MENNMSQITQNNNPTTGNYYQGTSTKNNNGTVMAGGSSSTQLSRLGVKRADVAVFASTVVESSLLGNAKAISEGTFSHNHVKPLTARVTTELAGVPSTALSKTADIVSRSIHKIESVVTNRTATAFRAGFNLFTGRYSSLVSTVTDSLGSDVAANPTMSVPGKVVYQIGKQRAVVDSYKPKTN